MSRIWNFPEYQLSSYEDQIWATHKSYPKIDLMDIVNYAKVTPQRAIKVKTNLGYAIINVSPDKWQILPKGLTKSYVKDGNVRKMVWMIKGKSPSGKNAEWFYDEDLSKSEDMQKYAKEIKDAQTKFYDDYFKKIAIDLEKRLPPAAKKAIKDNLAQLIHDKKTKELRQWFIDNKFENVPDENDFEKMVNLSGFIKSSKPDSWGHSTGTAVNIDWVNKKFTTYEWSSDD
jgi:hypothetical protein